MPRSRRNEPFVLRNALYRRGLHFDFLRLRCGSENLFRDAVGKIDCRMGEKPRTFIALSEWDAVVVLPCDELYPEPLTELYGTYEIASSIAGSAGYFAYLWDHDVNRDTEEKLNLYQRSGTAVLTSMRFEEWVRRDFGLAAEMLFCDLVERLLQSSNMTAIVAHTLGWNDVVVIVHAPNDEHRLAGVLSRLRLSSARDLLHDATLGSEEMMLRPVFAASYSHLIGSYDRFLDGDLSLGTLSESIAAATLLVRVAAPVEDGVRRKIQDETGLDPTGMPSEMGHYSLSADITSLAQAKGDGARQALRAIRNVRTYIGAESRTHGSSYAETSTIFRFFDPYHAREQLRIPAPDPTVEATLGRVKKLMDELPQLLEDRDVSPISRHRFSAVLTTLIDHLSDPIRSSVVRHLTTFILETASMLPELQRQELEDFCHVCEYAMTQATDGIVQFQHDANSLGLSGRGGYSRLILAVETYVQDLFDAMGVEKNVLITFGLRTGHIGVSARYQIDVPFNVLFAPSRWYILLHEVAHIVWTEIFGWRPESLAVYDHLEKEIAHVRSSTRDDFVVPLGARVEFIRTRELIRELFPNFLIYRIACGGDLTEFSRLSLRHILSWSRPGRGSRELLMAVVLHCMLDMTQKRRDWWRTWSESVIDPETLDRYVLSAIDGIGLALAAAAEESGPVKRTTISNRQVILSSPPFRDAVREAVESVTNVLSFVGRGFEADSTAAKDVNGLQAAIDVMIDHQADVDSWLNEGFQRWLVDGKVLAIAPAAHIWSRLLLQSRDDLRKAAKPAFMVSQLASLLSIWHRGVTAPKGDDKRTARMLRGYLEPLRLARKIPFS